VTEANVEAIAAEITAQLGEPTNRYIDREVGVTRETGWTWVQGHAPWGLRLEACGPRHVVRAFQHTYPGRRAELIRTGPPTDLEVRAVCVLAGLLPDWGQQ
jgi:hypothetical protein